VTYHFPASEEARAVCSSIICHLTLHVIGRPAPAGKGSTTEAQGAGDEQPSEANAPTTGESSEAAGEAEKGDTSVAMEASGGEGSGDGPSTMDVPAPPVPQLVKEFVPVPDDENGMSFDVLLRESDLPEFLVLYERYHSSAELDLSSGAEVQAPIIDPHRKVSLQPMLRRPLGG
jgi:hypothetical protein